MEERKIGTDVNQVQITSLNHIQGQPQVQELLRMSIDSYFRNRANNPDTNFGPVVLLGPPGVGKSITARAIHYELANLRLVESNGEMLSSVPELMSVLLTATNDTTVFIDESQALGTKAQHILLTAVSEKKLFVPQGKTGRGQREIPLANFTLILASTHEFMLQAAVVNRARILCRLDYYSIPSLEQIVKQRAHALGWHYENEQVLTEISCRAKGTPRLAINRNLQTAWNVCVNQDRQVITKNDVEEAFRLLQIDSLGLDPLEQAYLKELNRVGSVKLNVIASKFGLPRQTLMNVIEPYLLRSGLIEKNGSERILTEKGRDHISQGIHSQGELSNG
jgi:Holliday junction DNA helicase RuvB